MASALRVLKDVFGYDGFRDGQEQAVRAILQGRDVLAVMPTGAGKSICYQLPALLLPGVTLVVSPLISLMQDQVSALVQSGVRAAYLNTSLTPGQMRRALQNACAGMYRIIYVAPERLLTPAMSQLLCSVPVPLVAVDEAHCVSQWGQDFRPGYLDIARFIQGMPRRPIVAAFTATATREVSRDIRELLQLHNPVCVQTGYDRANLFFEVRRPRDKDAELLGLMDELNARNACGIVYCSTRRNVEDVAAMLRAHGYRAAGYHAGMDDEQRMCAQAAFVNGEANVIVATNAFGMGIDKSDVSFVVHYNLPKDMESYYQEAGRAGRDGSPARCVLLYERKDVATARFLIERSEHGPAQEGGEMQARALERLRRMTLYATAHECLRAMILSYFGESAPRRCGNCGNCDHRPAEAQRRMKRRPEDGREPVGSDEALFERLVRLRKREAQRLGVPAFVVFSNATLLDMSRKRPLTMDALLQVSGVGRQKMAQHGALFIREIDDFLAGR